MKFALLALLALAPLVVAQVPIPYTNCGTSADHVKIASATASIWPPIPGQAVTIALEGGLDETVTGGTYSLNVYFDGFPVVTQNGQLTDLPNITWPIPSGPFVLNDTITVPTVVPAGSVVLINGSAVDTNGQELLCITISATVPSAATSDSDDDQESTFEDSNMEDFPQTFDAPEEQPEDNPNEVSIFNDLRDVHAAAQAAVPSLKKLVGDLSYILSSAYDEVVADDSAFDGIPVPYTNCGQSTDNIQIVSITSTVWPPVAGSTADVAVNFNVGTAIADGTYTAVVSVDGFPWTNKSGDLAEFFKLPIASGPVSLTKSVTLPNPLPFSGSVGLQLSAVDNNNAELFCLQLAVTI